MCSCRECLHWLAHDGNLGGMEIHQPKGWDNLYRIRAGLAGGEGGYGGR